MLFYSLVHEYGPRPQPGFRTREEMYLLKTVLQDSINLLEQVGQLTSLKCYCGDCIPCCIWVCWCSIWRVHKLLIVLQRKQILELFSVLQPYRSSFYKFLSHNIWKVKQVLSHHLLSLTAPQLSGGSAAELRYGQSNGSTTVMLNACRWTCEWK